jgi:prophage regulatory protein
MTCAMAESLGTSRILRLSAVIDRTGLKRSTIYEHIAAGTFPKPIRLTLKSVGWVESEIDDWINKRIEQRDGK